MTFLLAQYRAIFKRAYFKGLATAVLMTAGLAAGAAQAADLTTSEAYQNNKAINATTSSDTFYSGSATASSLTVNSGASLSTSGDITVSGDAVLNGNLTVESGMILLADKKDGNTIYNHSLTSSGADIDINLSGNIGAASFNISGGSLELTSGGAGNTNLTAYGEGWIQEEKKHINDEVGRATANGTLTNVKITVNSGTNIAALGHLSITGSDLITLSGEGESGNVVSGDTAYLGGSRR